MRRCRSPRRHSVFNGAETEAAVHGAAILTADRKGRAVVRSNERIGIAAADQNLNTAEAAAQSRCRAAAPDAIRLT